MSSTPPKTKCTLLCCFLNCFSDLRVELLLKVEFEVDDVLNAMVIVNLCQMAPYGHIA